MVSKEEKENIYKAINNVSKKVNDIEKKLDDVLHDLHKQNAEKIEMDENGIIDIADSVSAHDDAIMELAEIVSSIVEGE